ncbi:MAG: aconitate hydratase [Chloroflexi bacterium]|nr:aconitate hydratase [Chloroflexota bacterium]
MSERHNLFNSLQPFTISPGRQASFYALSRLEELGLGAITRLPVCLRIVLESVLRNYDGKLIDEEDIRRLANWQPQGERTAEIPFVVARILLQDFTGVPVLVDLAAMRSAVVRLGGDPARIEPLVPVDLVIDHSVQVDFWHNQAALQMNMDMEMKRNRQRYQFLKWGAQAFHGFNVVPPGIGICHQVNLEHLAKGVQEQDGLYYPDTLVGTDSHTTMINGLGVLGWGVGGIEAEAGMLGQPIYILEPDVIGVHLRGALQPGVTATDLVLHITELLRRYKVVGKFVEFFEAGAASLSVVDRATIGNMAPEYGATVGFFPPDEQSCQYLTLTGRSPAQVAAFRSYYQAQGLFGMPEAGAVDYTAVLELDLATVTPSVAGPKRPQDRIDLAHVKEQFRQLFQASPSAGGYGKPADELEQSFAIQTNGNGQTPASLPRVGGGNQDPDTIPDEPQLMTSEKNTNPFTEVEMMQNRPSPDRVEHIPPRDRPTVAAELHHGDIVIAAITSCTNTSNPGVMLAAGLLARKAVERGLTIRATVKTSLAPGSRVVSQYLNKTKLQPYLDHLGFRVVGYGCTTCIGNSGPLDPQIEATMTNHDLVVAAVLSGNRNFEARVHQSVKANFLMSPPLVVAFALAGRVNIDLAHEPIGQGSDGADVYLRDLWPTTQEIGQVLAAASDPAEYQRLYQDFQGQNPLWDAVPTSTGQVYAWDPASTYIQEPPYFDRFSRDPAPAQPIKKARALAIFGNSVTTDHISPAGAIKPASPAGQYLLEHEVPVEDFNTYGARRGNDRVMVRGTFANIRIRNLMAPGVEGGVTIHQPSGEQLSIYAAAVRYQAAGIPLLVFAGQEYGTGSSRDWAAKGTALLGVRAVIAQSFERIHRANLVQMGVLPCQFPEGVNAQTLGLDGTEIFELQGLGDEVKPRQPVTLVIQRADQAPREVPLILRLDTPIEADYYCHGGILPYVLRQFVGKSATEPA